jgi:subtilisin family serine protease
MAPMMTKKALLVLAFPLTFSSVYARNAAIPREEVLLNTFTNNESVYVLRDAKGTIMQATLAGSPLNWFNLSPMDGSEGVRTEETYAQFGAEGSEIIVAVVDSGVDVNHEDLKEKSGLTRERFPITESMMIKTDTLMMSLVGISSVVQKAWRRL